MHVLCLANFNLAAVVVRVGVSVGVVHGWQQGDSGGRLCPVLGRAGCGEQTSEELEERGHQCIVGILINE